MRDRTTDFRPAVLQGEKRCEGSGLLRAPSWDASAVQRRTSERARSHAAANEPPDEPA